MNQQQVVIIGGGFCGLAAAYELARQGQRVTVLEADKQVGGLAGSFSAGGTELEKFYHHWFTNDEHVMQLIAELDLSDNVLLRPTRTGMYYANRFLKLSTPLDLLRFSPLSLADRIRLGLLTLRARRVKDWQALEERTAAEWLREMGSERVYKVVWEPLLRGKFGHLAEEVAAVWFWNKLKLRGGSRGRGGEEQLAYYRGGFAALAKAVAEAIQCLGGAVYTGQPVQALQVEGNQVRGVVTPERSFPADAVLATPSLSIIASLMAPHVSPSYVHQLQRIRYLANLCVVLELSCSLSSLYWVNVNDTNFPFVGIIEHTNFESTATYSGRHIVYLSKYLPPTDPLYRAPDHDVLDFSLHHLQRMFPNFCNDQVLDAHVWRADYAQPVVERGYGKLIPDVRTPLQNLFIATMAQIYPEDRGTNYAIRQGRTVAGMMQNILTRPA